MRIRFSVFFMCADWWNGWLSPALLYCRASGNYGRSIYFMGFQKRICRLWWNYRWNCDKLCLLPYQKENFISYFDLVMPAVSMAQGFGRIGCFCAGCCYGRETHAWYGITFTHSDFAPNGVSLIPTQLISSAGDFLICGVLLWYASKKPEPGRVAAGYLVLYGVGRFLIEFLRNDYRGSLGIFSTSQIISFGIVALGIALYFVIPKMMEKKE